MRTPQKFTRRCAAVDAALASRNLTIPIFYGVEAPDGAVEAALRNADRVCFVDVQTGVPREFAAARNELRFFGGGADATRAAAAARTRRPPVPLTPPEFDPGRFCRADIPLMNRGDAAAGDAEIPWRRVKATPRPRRG